MSLLPLGSFPSEGGGAGRFPTLCPYLRITKIIKPTSWIDGALQNMAFLGRRGVCIARAGGVGLGGRFNEEWRSRLYSVSPLTPVASLPLLSKIDTFVLIVDKVGFAAPFIRLVSLMLRGWLSRTSRLFLLSYPTYRSLSFLSPFFLPPSVSLPHFRDSAFALEILSLPRAPSPPRDSIHCRQAVSKRKCWVPWL